MGLLLSPFTLRNHKLRPLACDTAGALAPSGRTVFPPSTLWMDTIAAFKNPNTSRTTRNTAIPNSRNAAMVGFSETLKLSDLAEFPVLTGHESKLLSRLPREVGKDSRVRQTVLPQTRCDLERELLHSGGEENVRHDDGRNNEGRHAAHVRAWVSVVRVCAATRARDAPLASLTLSLSFSLLLSLSLFLFLFLFLSLSLSLSLSLTLSYSLLLSLTLSLSLLLSLFFSGGTYGFPKKRREFGVSLSEIPQLRCLSSGEPLKLRRASV